MPKPLRLLAQRWAIRLCGVLALAGTMPVLAQPVAPAELNGAELTFFLQDMADRLPGAPGEVLAALRVRERQLSGDPIFDYLLGLAALESGELLQALHALERVTLVSPNHAGAWIDLALAHTRMGDAQTAETLLVHVEENFSPPPALAARLVQTRQALAAMRWRGSWQGELALFAGHTSNANAGMRVDSITLTPIGAPPVVLDIDPARRPQEAAMVIGRAHVQYAPPERDGVRNSAGFVWRHQQAVGHADYRIMDFGLALQREQALGAPDGWKANYGLAYQQLRQASETVARVLSTHLGFGHPIGGCWAEARLEGERRFFAGEQPVAALHWLGGRLGCKRGGARFGAFLRSGDDRAQGQRPGGDTQRHELGLDWQQAFGERWMLDAQWQWHKAQDEAGYSPVLAANARRETLRRNTRVSLNYLLPTVTQGRWALQGIWEDNREVSNLALFQQREQRWLLGLRHWF